MVKKSRRQVRRLQERPEIDQVEEEEQGKRDEPSDNTVGHANVEHRVFHLKKEIMGMIMITLWTWAAARKHI